MFLIDWAWAGARNSNNEESSYRSSNTMILGFYFSRFSCNLEGTRFLRYEVYEHSWCTLRLSCDEHSEAIRAGEKNPHWTALPAISYRTCFLTQSLPAYKLIYLKANWDWIDEQKQGEKQGRTVGWRSCNIPVWVTCNWIHRVINECTTDPGGSMVQNTFSNNLVKRHILLWTYDVPSPVPTYVQHQNAIFNFVHRIVSRTFIWVHRSLLESWPILSNMKFFQSLIISLP